MGRWLKKIERSEDTEFPLSLLEERKTDLVDPDTSIKPYLNWPIQCDALFQVITIDERDQIEQLLRESQMDEALEMLRLSYKWARDNRDLFKNIETVFQNITTIATWIEDSRERYEERVAIMEFDGVLSREEAERQAKILLDRQ